MGEEDNIRLVPGKLWDERQRLEGQGASKGPLLLTLKCAGHTGAYLQSYGVKPGTPDITEANRETPGKYLKGILAYSSRKATCPTAQLRRLYTNAHSMNNEQGELEASMLLESYDLVAITEARQDESHDWSVTIDGYRLFRRDRGERRDGGVALYI
ncbi:nipped-b-like protein [Pitangus sulphuratus]|nr:nipped-b-like protein [Pitangus sulphuratus]